MGDRMAMGYEMGYGLSHRTTFLRFRHPAPVKYAVGLAQKGVLRPESCVLRPESRVLYGEKLAFVLYCLLYCIISAALVSSIQQKIAQVGPSWQHQTPLMAAWEPRRLAWALALAFLHLPMSSSRCLGSLGRKSPLAGAKR